MEQPERRNISGLHHKPERRRRLSVLQKPLNVFQQKPQHEK